MRVWITCGVVALLASGCGYKKEIGRLETVVSEQLAQLDERGATIASREATIDDLNRKVQDLQRQIDDLKADIAGLETDLDAERGKSARILADRGALRSEIDAMKTALEDLERRKRAAEDAVASYRDLVSRFQSLIDAGTLAVKIVDGRMVVVLATDVLFDSGSADLSAGGKEALTQVAQVLVAFPDRRFQIEGHTDNVPIATARYPSNWYLAAGRAIGVVDHLIAHGMKPTNLSAASFGEHLPVASNDTPGARAFNRRIEIVVVPDLSELPGYDELNRLAK